MSRLESELKPRFEIAKESETTGQGLLSLPLHLRKEAVQQFDAEFKLNDLRTTESKISSAQGQSPILAETLLNAKSLFDKGEYQLAQELYQGALKISPANEIAVRGLAECEKAFHQHEKALSTLKTLIAEHRTSENYKLLGDQLYAMSYLEDAVEAYMRSLQKLDLGPADQFCVYKNLGNIFLRLGDADSAEEFYNKAYTVDPDSDVLFVNYGSLFVYRGDYNKALERFREAIRLNDKNDKAWVGLAMIHREFGDIELAWANVEKALDINPYNESAIKLVADWAMKDNEIEKGVTRLRTYTLGRSEDAVMLMWLAKFLYFSNRLTEAKLAIEKSIQLNANLEGVYDVLAVIQAELHDREIPKK